MSTARTSRSLQPAFLARGSGRPGSRCASTPFAFPVLAVLDRAGFFAGAVVLDAAVGTERFSFDTADRVRERA
ncbi:hypothetical protein GCM10023258_01600 [Terrabacter aeriphilus]|uniref:Uncharacterized protein n=1 Tax=Terrabacter aeriphilus TaxID=515662 RepID=A0ABP9J1V7_9MICO